MDGSFIITDRVSFTQLLKEAGRYSPFITILKLNEAISIGDGTEQNTYSALPGNSQEEYLKGNAENFGGPVVSFRGKLLLAGACRGVGEVQVPYVPIPPLSTSAVSLPVTHVPPGETKPDHSLPPVAFIYMESSGQGHRTIL